MQRYPVHVADIFHRGAAHRVIHPDVTACARGPQGNSPGIKHLGIHDLRMERSVVGHQVGLDKAIAQHQSHGRRQREADDGQEK